MVERHRIEDRVDVAALEQRREAQAVLMLHGPGRQAGRERLLALGDDAPAALGDLGEDALMEVLDLE